MIPPLGDRLSPLPFEVIEHSSRPPSPWGGYQLCLADIPDCTHLVIVQDDVEPVPNFAGAVTQIAKRHASTPVCLFLSKVPAGAAQRARRALQKGYQYVRLYPAPFVPLVGMLWPRHKACEFLEWTKTDVQLRGYPNPRADDGICAQWVKRTKQEVLVACPSLVEHLGVPSIKGLRTVEGWKAMQLAEDGLDHPW